MSESMLTRSNRDSLWWSEENTMDDSETVNVAVTNQGEWPMDEGGRD
jgi:hypothetical protein